MVYNRALLKENAKSAIKGKTFNLFIGILIVLLISGAVGGISVKAGNGVKFVLNLISLAVSVLEIGLCGYILKFLDKGQIEYGEIFTSFTHGGSTYFRHLGLIIVRGIIVALWSLLLIIPGIIKAFAYSQAAYIMAENPDKDIMECLKESEEMMKGHKGDFFVLGLSFILWSLLIPITLGLILIYLAPYMQTAMAMFYRFLKPAYKEEKIADSEPEINKGELPSDLFDKKE